MLSVQARPHGRADEARARVERYLRRYSATARAAVRAAAALHPRIADLAVSFPALLFALAVPRRDADAARAVDAAIEGRPLAEVAQAAGVPLWLRRLPVEALTRPLPRLPDDETFRRRIANHVPRSPKLAPLWLDVVSSASEWSHPSFAIWVAAELVRSTKEVKLNRLKLLGLWAWFSMHPGTTAHRIIDRPLHPAMRFKTALAAAEDWRVRVALHVNLGEAPFADTWLTPGCVCGYVAALRRRHRDGSRRDEELPDYLRLQSRPQPVAPVEHADERTACRHAAAHKPGLRAAHHDP